jgi:hypothetical protein
MPRSAVRAAGPFVDDDGLASIHVRPSSCPSEASLQPIERGLEPADRRVLCTRGTTVLDAPEPERLRHIDWNATADSLFRHGLARLPRVMSDEECVRLRSLWSEPERFEHDVAIDDDRGRLAYRFFVRPLPSIVAELRGNVYARAVAIANAWQSRLGRAPFPDTHDGFLALCAAEGQQRTTPILLRYESGGFNAPHRDVYGSVFFPLQLVVTLGPGSSESGGGGELVLVDERPGRLRMRRTPTSVGDGVLFATRERPVMIAGVLGLQPVLHGVSEVRAPERFAVGIPFHEFRGT